MKERKIDLLLKKEYKIGGLKLQVADFLFVLCLFVFGFIIRWKLMPIESADYFGFLKDWMRQIREGGGFYSLKTEISNYSSSYNYIMCFLSYFSKNDLYVLKLISVFFDYMASIAAFLIIWQITASIKKSIIGMSILLLLPTVIIDSAYWCQCDVIYSSFLLFAVYFLLKDDSKKCLIFVGISLSFKLQALFIVPFLIIMWLKKKTVKLRHFLWIPIIYLISIIPAWMFGRPLKDLLLIYFKQSDTYPWGTLEYPNIYALLGESMPDMRHAAEVSGAGIFMTIMILGVIAYYLYVQNINITNRLVITLALFTVAIMVYSLPHMHDRYGFLIDLLAVLYGVINVRKLPITCGFALISIITFMPYLIAVHIVPIQYVAIALFGLIVYVGYDLYVQIKENMIGQENTDKSL